MIKHFFYFIFRNFRNQKGSVIINITGLAVGLAASLLIMMWAIDELSFEKFNKQADQIYLVCQDQYYSGKQFRVPVTPYPCAPVWKERIPEINETSRLVNLPKLLFRMEDKVFFETRVKATDPEFFKIFTIPIINGDAITILKDPHSIILTEKLAKKYFGEVNPVGKQISIENKFLFTVGAVMKDIPRNSDFGVNSRIGFDAIVPYIFLKEFGIRNESWRSNNIFSYVLLDKNVDINSINKKLTDIVIEHRDSQDDTKFFLFPWVDFHLRSSFGFERNSGAIVIVYIFMAIAFFIILIAGINFINLSIAKVASRGKEIGIKKVGGATRTHMIVQFIVESLIMVMIASGFAILIVIASLDVFNSIADKQFIYTDIFQVRFLIGFVIVGLVTTIIAGVYPAFYLSSLNPVLALKGENMTGRGKGRLRQALVVVQFTLSIFIASGAIFMFLQLKYMQEKELGYDKENLICVPLSNQVKAKYYSLKEELIKEPQIVNVTASQQNPTMIGSNSGGIDWEGKDPEKEVLVGQNIIDYNYAKTMKMDLVSGREFSPDFPGDKGDTIGNFMINEEMAKIMGGGDVVGKKFNFMGQRGVVIGVMKNFHFQGAQLPIEPIVFAVSESCTLNFALIRLSAGNISKNLDVVKKVWNKILPDFPFEYSFISQDYDQLYRQEKRMSLLLKYFTVIAVIIAALGLYGLSAFEASKRTKEVGVRKVVGANEFSVMYSMSKEFLSLVFFSIIIALPLGWFVIGEMLKKFAYRIDMSLVIFLVIAIGAVLIAIATISFHAYKAACTNPVQSLKVE